MNTVKSHHTIDDVKNMSKALTTSELMVRINPWNESSPSEIEEVIAAGAERIMLPMWKSPGETSAFLDRVNGRVRTTLLLETKEAAECLADVIEHPLIDEVHIGLNDLHLSRGMTFMFELLTDGTVERLCNILKAASIPYGFGGIARLGEGMLPAERVIMEHYRLGSTRAILSRSFCNTELVREFDRIEQIFSENMLALRTYEKGLADRTNEEYKKNTEAVAASVADIVKSIKERK